MAGELYCCHSWQVNILLKTCHYSTDPLLSSFLPLTIYFRVYLSFPFGRFASDYSESCISCSVCYEHGKLTVPFLFVTVFKHVEHFIVFFFFFSSPITIHKTNNYTFYTFKKRSFFQVMLFRSPFILITLLWTFSSFSIPCCSVSKTGNNVSPLEDWTEYIGCASCQFCSCSYISAFP